MHSATALLDPAADAEIAQARVFEKLLLQERAELLELSRATDDPTTARERLAEIHHLLQALRGRFPH